MPAPIALQRQGQGAEAAQQGQDLVAPLDIGHRLIHFGPTADFFARCRADPAKGSGKGNFFHDQLDRLLIMTGFDQGHISLNIGSGRTGLHTRCPVIFVDAVGDGNRLGERALDCLSHFVAFVQFIGK